MTCPPSGAPGDGMGRLCLIADDFGLGAKHNEVILSLLEGGILRGTSVMVEGDLPPRHLRRLAACRAQGAQIGLHLNLTHAFGAGGPPARGIMGLIGDAVLRRLSPDLNARFHDQADAFRQIFGYPPDYYDGHQHVHCLPGLSRIAATLPRGGATWIRVPLPANMRGLFLNIRAGGPKVLIIAALAYFARRQFRRGSWRMNHDFSGFLRLDDPLQVRRWLPKLLKRAKPGSLVMVHPGAADDPAQCPEHAAASREEEACILRAYNRLQCQPQMASF